MAYKKKLLFLSCVISILFTTISNTIIKISSHTAFILSFPFHEITSLLPNVLLITHWITGLIYDIEIELCSHPTNLENYEMISNKHLSNIRATFYPVGQRSLWTKYVVHIEKLIYGLFGFIYNIIITNLVSIWKNLWK